MYQQDKNLQVSIEESCKALPSCPYWLPQGLDSIHISKSYFFERIGLLHNGAHYILSLFRTRTGVCTSFPFPLIHHWHQ